MLTSFCLGIAPGSWPSSKTLLSRGRNYTHWTIPCRVKRRWADTLPGNQQRKLIFVAPTLIHAEQLLANWARFI
jgi:hypothetical protein